MPVSKWAFGAEVVNGKLYIIGGGVLTDADLDHAAAVGSVEVYDFETNTWDQSRTPMPTPRNYSGTAVVGDKIYVIGGHKADGSPYATKIIESYDTESDTWETGKATMDRGHMGSGTVALDGKIYVIGCWDSEVSYAQSMEIYDIETDTWEYGPSLPFPSGLMSCDIVNDKIIITGGVRGIPISKIQQYDPQSNTWEVLDVTLPKSMWAIRSCVYNNAIYLAGGLTVSGSSISMVVQPYLWRFDLETNQIFKIAELPTPREVVTLHPVGDQL